MEFEVIDVDTEKESLRIEIELPDRKRKSFKFPLNQGWEDEENGEMKAIKKIKQDLEKKEKLKKPSKKKLSKYIGKRK